MKTAKSADDPAWCPDIAEFGSFDADACTERVRKAHDGMKLELDLADGVSDPRSIDKAWTSGTGAPKGPFQVFDTVGLNTAMNIVDQYQKVPGIVTPLLRGICFPALGPTLRDHVPESKSRVLL